MNKIKSIVLGLVCLYTISTAYGQTQFYTGSWEQLIKKAQTENKPIFIDMYFTGCMPCREMDNRVFPDTKVANILNNEFIPYKVDVFNEKALGLKLTKKYAITGFPTFLILTADNHVIDIDGGFKGVDNFIRFLNSVTAKFANKKYYKGYSTSYKLDYPEFYRNSFEKRKLDKSSEEINDYLNTLADVDGEIPFLIMFKFLKEGKYVEYYSDHLLEFGNKFGTNIVARSMISKMDYLAKKYGETNNLEKYEAALSHIKELMAPNDWERLRIKCFYKPYYDVTKDTNWYIGKINNGNFDWQDRSNAYANIIVDSQQNRTILERLRGYYENNSERKFQSDVYKEVLINLFLKDYKRAADVMKYFENATKSPGISEEVISSLELAVSKEELSGLEILVAQRLKPIQME